jgi:hypothetical protein
LLLYAHFTNDGMHLSGERAIAAAIRALTKRFERAVQASQPDPDLMELWIRRPAIRPDGDGWLATRKANLLSAVVAAHPEASLVSGDAVLAGSRFYLRPVQLDARAAKVWKILQAQPMSGSDLIARSRATQLPAAQVRQLLHRLWQRRYVQVLRE